jgi:hypothetical protein
VTAGILQQRLSDIFVCLGTTDGQAWNELRSEVKGDSSTPTPASAPQNSVTKPTNTFGSSTKASTTSNKRKLVPDPATTDQAPKSAKQSKKEKKKEKDKKGLLSFGDDE